MPNLEKSYRVQQQSFPKHSTLQGKEIKPYYRDAFVFKTSKKDSNAIKTYHGIFAHLPKWVFLALRLRDKLVACFGFASSSQNSNLAVEEIELGKAAGFLTFSTVSEGEVIASSEDKNMDLSLSVLKLSKDEFAVLSLVNLKTSSGQIYMKVITPFHKLIAQHCIKQALKQGRI